MLDKYGSYRSNTYSHLRLRLLLDSLHLGRLVVKSMGGLAATDESRTQPKPPKIGPKRHKLSIVTAGGPCDGPGRPAHISWMAQLGSPHA